MNCSMFLFQQKNLYAPGDVARECLFLLHWRTHEPFINSKVCQLVQSTTERLKTCMMSLCAIQMRNLLKVQRLGYYTQLPREQQHLEVTMDWILPFISQANPCALIAFEI